MTGGVESEQLWVGLGNPGKDYEQTRHNIGFMALTAIAEAHGFTPFKNNKKLFAEVAEGTIGTSRVRALLPQTYMNDSGKAVAAAARFWGYAPEAILVIHDELDLVAGKIRLKHGGGDAGHNGLRSITAALSSANYRRLRIGIGAPQKTPQSKPTQKVNPIAENKMLAGMLITSATMGLSQKANPTAYKEPTAHHKERTSRKKHTSLNYVLSPFSRGDHERWLDALIKQTAEAAPLLLSGSEADNNRFINALHNAN